MEQLLGSPGTPGAFFLHRAIIAESGQIIVRSKDEAEKIPRITGAVAETMARAMLCEMVKAIDAATADDPVRCFGDTVTECAFP